VCRCWEQQKKRRWTKAFGELDDKYDPKSRMAIWNNCATKLHFSGAGRKTTIPEEINNHLKDSLKENRG
jgi:hypothetical protein